MADNSTSNGTGLTVEQLLTELGKLVFAISKQLVMVTQKLESIDSTVGEGIPGKLDRLAELLENSNEKLESIQGGFTGLSSASPPAEEDREAPGQNQSAIPEVMDSLEKTAREIHTVIGEGFGRFDLLDGKLDRIEETFRGSGEKLSESLDSLTGSGATIVERIDSLEEKLVSTMSDPGSATIEKMTSMEEKLASAVSESGSAAIEKMTSMEEKLASAVSESGSAAIEKMTSMEEKLTSAVSESGSAAIEKMTSMEEKLASAVSESGSAAIEKMTSMEEKLTSAVSESGSAAIEKMTSMEEKLAFAVSESGSAAFEKVTTLEEVLTGIKAGTDSVIELMTKRIEEAAKIAERPPHPDLLKELEKISLEITKTAGDIIISITDSDDSRKKLLQEHSEGLSTRIEAFPVAVKELGEHLSSKIQEFREEAGNVLEEASKTFEKSSSAMDSLKKIVEESTHDQNGRLDRMVELVEKHRESADNDEVEKLNSLAIRHFNNAEYGMAIESIEKALLIDSDRPELWSNLAHMKAASDDPNGAEEAFRKALQLNPELDQAVSGLGILMVDAGRPQDTIDFLKTFLEKESPSVRTMIAYGRALAETGRHSEAVEIINRAKELAPNNPEVEAELARYSESS